MTDTDSAKAGQRLREAAAKIRDLATRANTCLSRAELQWTDLTVSDTAYRSTNSPMVWSHYAAAMHPGVGEALARLLDERAWIAENDRGAFGTTTDTAALALADAVLGPVAP